MSHRANYWLAALDPSRVKSGAFRVLFHLCDHHNGEADPSRACFPSQETLKARTGMSNGALNDALAQLEKDALIRRIRSTQPGTSTRRTYYVLECDFGYLDKQTPETGVCPNSGPPETAQKLTPVFGQANSGFQGGKLRPTGEEPVSNQKEPSRVARARGQPKGRPCPHLKVCVPKGSSNATDWDEFLQREKGVRLKDLAQPLGDGWDVLWARPPSTEDAVAWSIFERWFSWCCGPRPAPHSSKSREAREAREAAWEARGPGAGKI